MPASTKAKKCAQCGSSNLKQHKMLCPAFKCPECKLLVNSVGHHAECSMKMQSGDGGRAARDEAAERKAERAPIGVFFPVSVELSELEAFQKIINEGFFAGESQKQVACEYEEPHGDGVVKCSNISPPGMAQKVVKHCPTCERDQKKSVLKLCILHAARCWGGSHPHHTQTRMDL